VAFKSEGIVSRKFQKNTKELGRAQMAHAAVFFSSMSRTLHQTLGYIFSKYDYSIITSNL
jgi:hypothetical protein